MLYRFVRSGNGRLLDCELISYLYYVSFHLLKIRIIYRRSSFRKFIFSSINVYFESTLIFKKLWYTIVFEKNSNTIFSFNLLHSILISVIYQKKGTEKSMTIIPLSISFYRFTIKASIIFVHGNVQKSIPLLNAGIKKKRDRMCSELKVSSRVNQQ